MTTRRRQLLFCIAVALCAGGAWLSASDDDDRPPIIVQSGSIRFDGGDAAHPEDPKQCCYNFKRDWIGNQFKPVQPFGGKVLEYEVSITEGSCKSEKPMHGQTVEIDYTEDDKTVTFTFYIEPFFLFGKKEPKLDSPVELRKTDAKVVDEFKKRTKDPGVLEYGNAKGLITRIKVGTNSACTPTGRTVVSVQPVVKKRVPPKPVNQKR